MMSVYDIGQNLARLKTRLTHFCQEYRYNVSMLRKKEPLLVYQMGKVGSSTIIRSLHGCSLDMFIYHIHYMRDIGNMVQQCRRQGVCLRDHILASKYFRKKLEKGYYGPPIKIITLVRDPLARNISQFFQSIEIAFPKFDYRKKIRTMEMNELEKELADYFFDNFPHNDPLTWFDRELKHFFQVDVFATPFEHEKGYQIYKGALAEVLLIRLEDLNWLADNAIHDFLGINGFQLIDANISKDKEYAETYRKFVNTVIMPMNYIEMMYTSKLAIHFYTPDELQDFRTRWSRNSWD